MMLVTILLALGVLGLFVWVAASHARIAQAEQDFAAGLERMHDRVVQAEKMFKGAGKRIR